MEPLKEWPVSIQGSNEEASLCNEDKFYSCRSTSGEPYHYNIEDYTYGNKENKERKSKNNHQPFGRPPGEKTKLSN